MTNDLRTALREHKNELLELLRTVPTRYEDLGRTALARRFLQDEGRLWERVLRTTDLRQRVIDADDRASRARDSGDRESEAKAVAEFWRVLDEVARLAEHLDA